jgi:hypothetical protein
LLLHLRNLRETFELMRDRSPMAQSLPFENRLPVHREGPFIMALIALEMCQLALAHVHPMLVAHLPEHGQAGRELLARLPVIAQEFGGQAEAQEGHGQAPLIAALPEQGGPPLHVVMRFLEIALDHGQPRPDQPHRHPQAKFVRSLLGCRKALVQQLFNTLQIAKEYLGRSLKAQRR